MTEASPLCAIDANVIVRYVLGDNERLYHLAEAIFLSIQSGETRALLEPVILSEVVFVLTTVYEMPRQEISEGLISLISAPGFVMPDKPHYLRALALLGTSVPHFGDACACAAAIGECDGRLYSFDKKLSAVEGVTRMERPAKS